MSSNQADEGQGVSSCYVFKSLLQEYAQKAKLPTPVYSTTKEGPSHEPTFRSTVVVNGEKYDSLPGFFSRKAAEQSAAEVALMQLANSGGGNQSYAQPVYETGLCKNLLQEYAQKMNYAIPLYECQKNEMRGREGSFYCTVEIGGIKYIGAAARTKKEAEIKVARTALLAIHSAGSGQADKPSGNSIYTVTPSKRKASNAGINPQSTASALEPKKKKRFKKKLPGKKYAGVLGSSNYVQNKEMNGNSQTHSVNGQMGQELSRVEPLADRDLGIVTAETTRSFQDEKLNPTGGNVGEFSAVNHDLGPCTNGGLETAVNFQEQGKDVGNGADVMPGTE